MTRVSVPWLVLLGPQVSSLSQHTEMTLRMMVVWVTAVGISPDEAPKSSRQRRHALRRER